MTLQGYGADQIRKISKASKRWIVWTPTVGGVAIASCLSMISSAESERPLPSWLTSVALGFISLVIGTLFAVLPWAKLQLDGEIAAEEQKENTELAERTLDEIASEAAEFLSRLKAMNEHLADGRPSGVEAGNDPASAQKPATNATATVKAG